MRLENDAGPYLRGERWAEPSHEDAVTKLRQVASDPALRQRLGARARLDCAAQLAPEVVGHLLRNACNSSGTFALRAKTPEVQTGSAWRRESQRS